MGCVVPLEKGISAEMCANYSVAGSLYPNFLGKGGLGMGTLESPLTWQMLIPQFVQGEVNMATLHCYSM
jgi:hypothetical protein